MTSLFSGTSSGSTPNIVLLLVDDLGWSDLGYRQPENFESPHIDQLARESIDFEQCYIASPSCSPSRATLLTGQHPGRLGMVRHITGTPAEEFHFWKTDPAQVPSRNWLPLEHVTYAKALKELGYYNQFIGKWHLGGDEYYPLKHGFDAQVGTTHYGHPKSFYPTYFQRADAYPDAEDTYLTDKLTNAAVEFINGYDKPQPFTLSLSYYAVHTPHIGRKDYVKYFQAKGHTGAYAEYLAMVKSVDDSVGRIRAALAERDLAQNTVIIFISDQGGIFRNPPFRGGKMSDTLAEGGARVPLLVLWPGVTQPAKNSSVIQSTDLFPTLIEIAGGNPQAYPHMDGVSLLDVLKNNHELQRGEPIFGYRAYEDLYVTVREGDWKLWGYRSGKVELYNLRQDVAETTDLADQFPAQVAKMKAQLVAWEQKMGLTQYSGFKTP